jgi:hypothetical protein
MNPVLKWKLIAGFLLIFIAGGVTGAFFGATLAKHLLLGHEHHDIVATRMRDRLQRELDLTPQQVAKISPIIERSAARLEGIRMATTQEVRQTFTETHRQIADNLDEQQRARFERMNERRQKWMRSHSAGIRSSPSPLLEPVRE